MGVNAEFLFGASALVLASDAPEIMRQAADQGRASGLGPLIQICDGVADDVQIQAAIDALTSGRTRKEKVVLIGGFTTTTAIDLPSYTILEIQGTITYGGADSATFKIITSDTTESIEIYGGELFGDSKAAHCIECDGISNFSIHDILFHNVRQAGSYVQLWNSSYGQIVNNRFDCNSLGLGVNLFDSCYNITVSGNAFNLPYDSAVDVSMVGTTGTIAHNIVISNNTVLGLTAGDGYGFACHNRVKNITFANNKVTNAKYDGVGVIWDGSSTQPSNISIIGNTINDTSRYGIVTQGLYTSIVGNIINGCLSNTGINVQRSYSTVAGNICNGNYRGIEVNADALYTTITGNICRDDGSTTSEYGIILTANTDYVNINANDLTGNTIANFLNNSSGTHITVRNNMGYVTENSSTATVLNTATSIAVAHGLATTPTRVFITPKENPTNPVTFWWVDTVGATNFTINVNADPGASNLDFDWEAKV